jgi:hypothetical protein
MYLKGEDEHFVFKLCKNRKDAEYNLQEQLDLYKICYDINNADYGIITNKEFQQLFPDPAYQKSFKWIRLGNKLIKRLREYKEWEKKSRRP